MRGTPLLIQLYLHLLRPRPADSRLDDARLVRSCATGICYAIFAFSINTAGYTGEILRGAILAVPHGEIEAARAFGMSRFQVFFGA